MDKIETIETFIKKVEDKDIHIIYGAGTVGKVIGEFLKNRQVSVEAYTITILDQRNRLEGIPIYSLEYILQSYRQKDIIFIIAATGFNQLSIKKELDNRNVTSYLELSETVICQMIHENREKNARKAELNKERKPGKTIGYLKPGYLDSDYAEERLIINKIAEVSYIAMPKETAYFFPVRASCEKKIESYRSLMDACYCPDGYVPEVSFIHTFNTVCCVGIPWCASFETIIPRVWPETEQEKKYFLQLMECLKRPNCKALYALSQNAYNIERNTLLSVLPRYDAELIIEKMRVLHPPQDVLITEEEFKKKHAVSKVHFIFIGRLFFIKGGREIIQALSELEDKYEFKLTLISSFLHEDYFTKTPYEEMIRCKELVKSKRWIDYYENLSNESVLEKCKEATVGLLPSVAETYGYAVLEMQASGCPVVTTNIRAFPENNNRECGWVCNLPVDEFGCCIENERTIWSEILQGELKRCFQEILIHPEEIKRKGKKAIEQIRRLHDPARYQEELRKNIF